jgi:hypothetical protein
VGDLSPKGSCFHLTHTDVQFSSPGREEGKGKEKLREEKDTERERKRGEGEGRRALGEQDS